MQLRQINFVLTRMGDIIEIQGTSEKAPISWENFAQFKTLALEGVDQLFSMSDKVVPPESGRRLLPRITSRGASLSNR